MSSSRRLVARLMLAKVTFFAAPAAALTLEVPRVAPSLVGAEQTFSATTAEASGEVTFEWRFGEGDYAPGGAEMSHVFTTPGLHSVDVVATDANGDTASAYFLHLVHHPLTAARPTSSSSIVYDAARKRVYSVNQDNDTVTSIDAERLEKLAELAVYGKPESLAILPDGKLWVVHQDDYAVAVVEPDQFVVERGFRLPYASQPVGIAVSPTGDAAYVSLLALGKLLKLDPTTGNIVGEAVVGPSPRGIAVSHDGSDVYVTRFISSDAGGEVVKVDAASMTVETRILLALDTESMDSDQEARGLPNYLFSVALTPDGRQAWVPGKKDNVLRGLLRDGQDLTHDTTVRPLAAIIDIASATEVYENRVDLDDRSNPVHVEFSPYGNLAILTLAGSNRIEVRDVNRPTQVFSAIAQAGTFPRASVLAPGGRLFVQGALSRDVVVYDMTAMLDDFDQGSPDELATIPAVADEKLAPQVLEGKKIFHNAEDVRMSFEGYISCGSCHFEGIDDGRVYDFSTRGEGLRNTITLLGHKGTQHGRFNWTGTLDETQDFEHQIRDLFDGLGFLPEESFHVGTRDQPLGDPKAGHSAELDALAAYVASLDRVSPSPYRNADGSLTPDGVAGKALFAKLGCDFCHGGPDFTDSARGMLHDVGTTSELSGMHAGAPLLGIDTPTLLGVWETPPYLHDGSAATLRDVLTTRNPTDLHGYVSALSAGEVDQLVAYVSQIDGELPIRRLPFEPPALGGAGGAGGALGGAGGSGGAAGSGGSSGGQGGAGAGGGAAGAPVAGATGEPPAATTRRSSGCAVRGRASLGGVAAVFVVLGLAFVARRVRRARRAGAWLAWLALLSGCGSAEPPRDEPGAAGSGGSAGAVDPWSALPAVVHPDPELAPLGTRQESYQRLCARGRGDGFAKALCGGGRPQLDGMAQFLELAGLGMAEKRAFALTANSTSLVAMSVSAVNPRILVFPRVEGDLAPPDAMTAVGFVRGEPFVEVVSRDLATRELNFYLLVFERACDYQAGGCDLASLLTEELEHGWTAYSVYDHDDLERTSFDCLSCHRPGGQGTPRILRMQELASPWMHWFPQRFAQRTESDRVLLAQFADAHGVDTQYGGVPLPLIVNALDEGSAAQLEALVRAEGFGEQPNPFDAQIAAEMRSGSSATWQARFDAHLRGAAIAVPYPGIDVTDEARRSAAVRSYQDVVRGVAPRESLLDLRPVFSDDARAKLSFEPQPGADGKTVLLQMCARCHDGRGDPSLAKNRFDVLRLDQAEPALKSAAVARMNAADETRMPPWRVGTMTPEAIQAATLELQK